MKSAGKARNNGLYRHIRTSKEIIRNLLNDYPKNKTLITFMESSITPEDGVKGIYRPEAFHPSAIFTKGIVVPVVLLKDVYAYPATKWFP